MKINDMDNERTVSKHFCLGIESYLGVTPQEIKS